MKLIINIDVEDLDQAVAFYQAALGLQLVRRLFNGQVAEMGGAGALIQLLHKPAGSSPAQSIATPRDYSRHWTPVHLDFEVDDVEKALEQALAAGAVQEGEIRSFVWGRIATLSDPFGHGFCLLELTPGGYDTVAA